MSALKSQEKGCFIAIEGGEGVGKSTNISFIRTFLEAQGLTVKATREPGGTPMAEEIRQVLLDKRDEIVHEETELLLMFAARAQHLKQLIVPALAQGCWVLCDRFTDATYAYQGGGRGMDEQKIALLENLVQGDLRPDLVLLLDLPVEEGIQRAAQRGELDRFESEKLDFYQRIRKAYLARAKALPERYRIIDATQSLEQVQQDIRVQLEEFILTAHKLTH